MKHIDKKNVYMKRIEHKQGEIIEELLRKKFVDENKSIETIANELQISYATTIKWLLMSGIYSRKLNI